MLIQNRFLSSYICVQPTGRNFSDISAKIGTPTYFSLSVNKRRYMEKKWQFSKFPDKEKLSNSMGRFFVSLPIPYNRSYEKGASVK